MSRRGRRGTDRHRVSDQKGDVEQEERGGSTASLPARGNCIILLEICGAACFRGRMNCGRKEGTCLAALRETLGGEVRRRRGPCLGAATGPGRILGCPETSGVLAATGSPAVAARHGAHRSGQRCCGQKNNKESRQHLPSTILTHPLKYSPFSRVFQHSASSPQCFSPYV